MRDNIEEDIKFAFAKGRHEGTNTQLSHVKTDELHIYKDGFWSEAERVPMTREQLLEYEAQPRRFTAAERGTVRRYFVRPRDHISVSTDKHVDGGLIWYVSVYKADHCGATLFCQNMFDFMLFVDKWAEVLRGN